MGVEGHTADWADALTHEAVMIPNGAQGHAIQVVNLDHLIGGTTEEQ